MNVGYAVLVVVVGDTETDGGGVIDCFQFCWEQQVSGLHLKLAGVAPDCYSPISIFIGIDCQAFFENEQVIHFRIPFVL